MKTVNAKFDESARKWWIVDATDKTLGRLATEVAHVIRGKHKPSFTPNVDGGDFVIVVNSEKIKVTGNKLNQKKYYRHSRFFGGLREFTAAQMVQKDAAYMIEEAVKGMLPKTKLGRHLGLKLKAYVGADHPHKSQKPMSLEIK